MTTLAPSTIESVPGDRRAQARERVACAHCSLGVPQGLIDDSRAEQFCCQACRLAFDTIHSCGLDRYYALRRRLGETPRPVDGVPARPGSFARFDDPAFLSAFARPVGADGSILRVELVLEGVHCAACMWLIERVPRIVTGVRAARLDLRRAVVELEWDPRVVALSRVASALATLGYRPHPVIDSASRDARRRQDRDSLVRIGVAGACAGNAMLLAFALYSGEFAGMHPAYTAAFTWISALVGLLSLLWPGRVFIDSAVASIRARTWHLDTPIAAALVIGNGAGLVSALRGRGDVFADSLTMLVFLLLVGRWLQLRQQRAALDGVELLFSLTHAGARVVDQDTPDAPVRDVAIESVRPGDVVEIRPQETVPIDGVVVLGRSTVDSSILTGESRPVPVAMGDDVVAGGVNLADTIRVRATAVGRETRAGRMMATIEALSRSRTPIVGVAQALAKPFVIGVTLLAALTLALHAGAGLAPAMRHAIALLVATCPCVVALATPLVVTLGVGRAARRGVLIKGGDVFEQLARPGLIVLDKTGTLTTGRFEMLEWHGDAALRPLVAAAEASSTHPVGVALSHAGGSEGAGPMEIEHVLGRGVIARREGLELVVGSPAWVASLAAPLSPLARDAIDSARSRGLTPIAVARNGVVEAVGVLGDRVRPDAPGALDALRAAGWRIAMLSGDDPAVVHAVASRLGIDPALAWGGASPEDKQHRISQLRAIEAANSRRPAPVVMVGDGVNDAPALARADVGIAVRGGAEASLAAADAYVGRGGLFEIAALSDASRRVLRTIRLCLGIAVAYNLVAGALAVAGVLSPLVAAALMPMSSICVLTLAIRARTVTPPTADSSPDRRLSPTAPLPEFLGGPA